MTALTPTKPSNISAGATKTGGEELLRGGISSGEMSATTKAGAVELELDIDDRASAKAAVLFSGGVSDTFWTTRSQFSILTVRDSPSAKLPAKESPMALRSELVESAKLFLSAAILAASSPSSSAVGTDVCIAALILASMSALNGARSSGVRSAPFRLPSSDAAFCIASAALFSKFFDVPLPVVVLLVLLVLVAFEWEELSPVNMLVRARTSSS